MDTIQFISVGIIPLIFAICLHEVAHGYVASFFGDKTAKLAGRLTLNPINHIDVIGTIIIPGLLIFLNSPFIFGWAKPVPVDPRNLRNPRRDMALVALAGPFTNILMAFFWGSITKVGSLLAMQSYLWLGKPLAIMGLIGIKINIILAILNLIPIPPLDGSKILSSILPRRLAYQYALLEPFGFVILIILLMTNVLTVIMEPLFGMLFSIIFYLFGLNHI